MDSGTLDSVQRILNAGYDKTKEAFKTTASFSGDIEIGAVEIKNGTDDTRAVVGFANSAAVGGLAVNVADANVALNTVRSAANSARGTATPVACVQHVDAAGNVLNVTSAATARLSTTVVLPVQILDAAGIVNKLYVPTTLSGFSKTVGTSGTGEAIGTTLACSSVYVRAKSANTSAVYVGDSGVDKTSNKQIILSPNESFTLDISNVATVFVDVDVNNEGVDCLAII